MNIEQLQELLERARTAVEADALVREINNLALQLDGIASNPADGGSATEYQLSLARVIGSAAVPARNAFSPREIGLMRSMGIAIAAGHELLVRIRNISEDQKLLPQNRAQEFRRLADELTSIVARSNKLGEVARELNLKEVVGTSGDSSGFNAEFSWFIPRPKVDTSLSLLKAEVRDLETLLSSAGTLVGKPGYRILYLSASEFGFDFATCKETVDLILNSLTWFVDKYEVIANLKNSVEDWIFSKKTKEEMNKELDQISADQFLDLAGKAVSKAMGDKTGAPEEISRLSRSISIVARKLHDGYQFDARYLIEATPEANGDEPSPVESSSSEIAELIAKIGRIESALKALPQLPAPPPTEGEGE